MRKMTLFNFLTPWLEQKGPDRRLQLQYKYNVLHKAVQETEEACHRVEEAIQHLAEDNQRLVQIIQSRQAEGQ